LIEHHGDSILRLAGVRGIEWWRPLQADLVQSRRVPDGLIEAKLRREAKPARFLLEISTYPYGRLSKQVVEGMMVAYLNRGEWPDLLTLVMHGGRHKRVGGVADLASPHGWTRLRLEWKVVELLTTPAADLLATNDLGLIPGCRWRRSTAQPSRSSANAGHGSTAVPPAAIARTCWA
jgi:hypothetical protein